MASAALNMASLASAWDYSRQRAADSTVVVWHEGGQFATFGDADKVRGVASISKTLTAITVHSGGFPLATLAHTLMPAGWVGDDARKRDITFGHLLTMTSGLEPDDQPGGSGYLERILGQPTVAAAGARWAYASLPVDLLGICMQEQTGRTVKRLFDERVARKIGVPDVTWTNNPTPYTRASSGATMSARNLARIGQMLLNGGFLGSGRVLTSSQHKGLLSNGPFLSGAVFQATPGSPFRIPQGSLSVRSYGRLLWSNRAGILGAGVPQNAYFAWGLREQFLAVFPSQNTVVVRLGAGPISDPAFRIEFFRRVADAF